METNNESKKEKESNIEQEIENIKKKPKTKEERLKIKQDLMKELERLRKLCLERGIDPYKKDNGAKNNKNTDIKKDNNHNKGKPYDVPKNESK